MYHASGPTTVYIKNNEESKINNDHKLLFNTNVHKKPIRIGFSRKYISSCIKMVYMQKQSQSKPLFQFFLWSVIKHFHYKTVQRNTNQLAQQTHPTQPHISSTTYEAKLWYTCDLPLSKQMLPKARHTCLATSAEE